MDVTKSQEKGNVPNTMDSESSVPMRALKVGLKHHQLDTIAFFLKARENVLVSETTADSEQSTSKLCTTNMAQILSSVQLIIDSINENSNSASSAELNFSQCLSVTVMRFLNHVIRTLIKHKKDNCSAGQDTSAEIDGALSGLIGFVKQLRQSMDSQALRRFSTSERSTGASCLSENEADVIDMFLDPSQKELVKEWKELPLEDVLARGILHGDVPLLQTYLTMQQELDKATFEYVSRFGKRMVLDYLHKKEFELAHQICINLGLEFTAMVKQVLLFTYNLELRDFVAKELERENQLDVKYQELLKFAQMIEKVYPHHAYEAEKAVRETPPARYGVKSTATKRQRVPRLSFRKWTECLGLESILEMNPISGFLQRPWKNSCTESSAISEPGFCSQLLLEWLVHWSPKTVARILLEPLMITPDSDLGKFVDADTLWKHLGQYLDISKLICWLDCSLSGKTPKPKWCYGLEPTANHLEDTSALTEVCRDDLLERAAELGVFTSEELEDFYAVFARLAQLDGAISHNYALDNYMSMTEFHKKMVFLILEREQPHLLNFYLDFFKLCQGSTDFSSLGIESNALPSWAKLLLSYKYVASRPSDGKRMALASRCTNHFLLNSGDGSEVALLNQGHILTALALFAYDPQKLQELLQNKGEGYEALKQCCTSEPMFQQIWFPELRVQDQLPEISIYLLLQNEMTFDISQLFQWQTTNTLSCETIVEEMPHFSNTELVANYGHSENLQFSFYLKQGRSCYALSSFLRSKYLSGSKSLSKRRLSNLEGFVHQLAIRQFFQSPVASSCVAFLDMLALNTSSLRVDIQVAALVLLYEMTHTPIEAKAELEKEIAELVLSCPKKGNEEFNKVLDLLESATRWHLTNNRTSRTSFEAARSWQLVTMFCTQHGQSLSDQYLVECASEDDWLPFLVYAQLHQFPKSQLCSLLAAYPSGNLREHLHYVIENVSHDSATAKTVPERVALRTTPRDIRHQLYNRIGLFKAQENTATVSSSGEDTDSTDETIEEESLAEHANDENAINACDVFTLLLKCSEKKQPGKTLTNLALTYQNPVLAILAGCMQSAELLSCVSAWIYSSAPLNTHQSLSAHFGTKIKDAEWTTADLQSLLLILQKEGVIQIALQAFTVFLPNCPFIPFLRFSVEFQSGSKLDVCRQCLEDFKQGYAKIMPSKTKEIADSEDLFSKQWIEATVSQMLHHYLQSDTATYDIGAFLQLISETNLTKSFSCKVGDFKRLFQFHQICISCDIKACYKDLAFPGESSYDAETGSVLNQLLDAKLFKEARLFIEVSGIDGECISVKQVDDEINTRQWSKAWLVPAARCDFWSHCDKVFVSHNVPASVASQFFQEHRRSTCDSHEKFYLCKLSYDWLMEDPERKPGVGDDLFMEMWLNKVEAKLNRVLQQDEEESLPWVSSTDSIGFEPMAPAPRSELLEYSILPELKNRSKGFVEHKKVGMFSMEIGSLLDSGHLKEACHISDVFHFYTQDLDIIVNCLEIARGKFTPNQLPVHIKTLLANEPVARKRTHSYRDSSAMARLTSVLHLPKLISPLKSPEEELDAVLSTLELLSAHVQYGALCSDRVLTNYKVSKLLHRSFDWVLQQDEFSILHALLSTESEHQFLLAKNLISSSNMEQHRVAEFLAGIVVDVLQVSSGLKMIGSVSCKSLTQYMVGESGRLQHMGELVQLCDDHSTLGQVLLDSASNMTSNELDYSSKEYSVVAELLINAHDCFTLACNMEGIAKVLHAVRHLSVMLESSEEYNIMIRLLTGIGRFSEMTYVFDILMQQHQFELLFKKGRDKEEKLRQAILDYLQRFHPEDSENFTMVSLHFTMFRQIGNMLEDLAKKQLANFNAQNLDSSPATVQGLQNIIHYFSDAADNFLKEQCVKHAEACLKQAKLVALQSYLLTNNQIICIVNLSRGEVIEFISNHPKFYEAFIVADAYAIHDQWSGGLLKHVVLNNDQKYLQDYSRHLQLTPSTISEIAERYSVMNNKPVNIQRTMKSLLLKCNDICMRYKLSQMLGMSDCENDLLTKSSGPYIKDMIKKGLIH